MHSLTIVFGPSPVPWVLLFRSEEAALAAWKQFEPLAAVESSVVGGKPMTQMLPRKEVSIADDFGQHIRLTLPVHGVMFEDMELSKMAHVEQGLHRARTQAKAQTMAQGDPTLRAASVMGGAPMLSPMGNGAFRGQ